MCIRDSRYLSLCKKLKYYSYELKKNSNLYFKFEFFFIFNVHLFLSIFSSPSLLQSCLLYTSQDNISDTTKYEDHFVAENRLIAISKSGRSMDSEDVQNFLNATERGIDVQLFVRKNKDDKISKEFYYLGRVIATGNAKQFVMPNTDKTAVEIEWELELSLIHI